MKYVMFTALLLNSCIINAAESPYDKFSAKSNFTDNTHVKWVQVDNIIQGCNAESKKRRLPEYTKPIDGCSFWDKELFGHTCLIITPRHVDFWTFGHELRHCFQGQFHNN